LLKKLKKKDVRSIFITGNVLTSRREFVFLDMVEVFLVKLSVFSAAPPYYSFCTIGKIHGTLSISKSVNTISSSDQAIEKHGKVNKGVLKTCTTFCGKTKDLLPATYSEEISGCHLVFSRVNAFCLTAREARANFYKGVAPS